MGLARAELIVNLCERFHCLPSALHAEDASFLAVVRLVDVVRSHKDALENGEDGDR